MESKPLTFNQRRLFADVMNHILSHRKQWDQGHWHGTIENARVLDSDGDPFDMELSDEYGYSREQFKLIHRCGTSHCFAGWVDILRGLWSERTLKLTTKAKEKYGHAYSSVAIRARSELGINAAFGEWLFNGSRTLDELYIACRAVVDGTLKQEDIAPDGAWHNWHECAGEMLLKKLIRKGVKRKTKLKAKPAALL